MYVQLEFGSPSFEARESRSHSRKDSLREGRGHYFRTDQGYDSSPLAESNERDSPPLAESYERDSPPLAESYERDSPPLAESYERGDNDECSGSGGAQGRSQHLAVDVTPGAVIRAATTGGQENTKHAIMVPPQLILEWCREHWSWPLPPWTSNVSFCTP